MGRYVTLTVDGDRAARDVILVALRAAGWTVLVVRDEPGKLKVFPPSPGGRGIYASQASLRTR
jgi:hypothetical protein